MAINCSGLAWKKDRASLFLQKLGDEGHYRGQPRNTTRQGMYAATADGTLLASRNSTVASHIQEVLQKALKKWHSIDPDKIKSAKIGEDNGFKRQLPKDGLVLREIMRDIPRSTDSERKWEHNLDHMWLSKSEMLEILPNEMKVGAKKTLKETFRSRLFRFHLVDQVRGESSPWNGNDIKSGELISSITKIDGDRIHVSLIGNAKIERGSSEKNSRGVDLKIAGKLVFNRKTSSYVEFKLLAVGNRWGTDVFSMRHKDLKPNPIGFAFQLMPKEVHCPAPAHAWMGDYFK